MKHPWLRLLPTVAVSALLLAAALLPSRRAGARPEAAPAAVAAAYPNCDVTVQAGGRGAIIGIVGGAGVTQPLRTDYNVSACSLEVAPYAFNGATMKLVEWNPLTLAPDPTTVALRTRSFDVSAVYYSQIHTIWTLPLVTRLVPRLADPPRGTVALDLASYSGLSNIIGVQYQTDGPVDVPLAYNYAAGASRVPLSGGHPVLSHGVCGGDSTLQSLRVMQSVRTTDAMLDTSRYEVMQRFRVPAETRLRWVELAFGVVVPRSPVVPGRIAILEAAQDGPPSGLLPPELVGAAFDVYGIGVAAWDSHYDFDHVITLEPDHDYWLLARTTHDYGVYTHLRNGGEGADYVAAIGGLYTRTVADVPWTEQVGSTLCFKLVGEPTGVAGVPHGGPSPGALRLRVTPNPSRGVALVRWEGASGAVRFEVIDARGRRVGAGAGASGAVGGWSWRGIAADGQPLPAGVYFVRAIDSAGGATAERVVLVR